MGVTDVASRMVVTSFDQSIMYNVGHQKMRVNGAALWSILSRDANVYLRAEASKTFNT